MTCHYHHHGIDLDHVPATGTVTEAEFDHRRVLADPLYP
jgi:hypothetical protein